MILDTDLCRFEISKGIFIIYYKSGVRIRLEDADRIINTRHEMSRNAIYPLLIVDEGIISVENSAWKLFASDHGTSRTSAGAFLLQSVYSRILANFFLKFIKPNVPVQVFSNKKKALEWLETYKLSRPEAPAH
jgi:hypothetical protein